MTEEFVRMDEEEELQSVKGSHHDKKEKGPEPTLVSSFKEFFLASYVNVLLIFVPIGIASGAAEWTDTVIFVLNFLAIVPLANLMGDVTEQLALRTSQSLGGLMNATFGNAVELIIGIFALKEGLVRVVQASVIGSILSNLLLVLGMCFLFGGIKHLPNPSQKFNKTAASTSAGLLLLCVFGFLMPAALYSQLETDTTNGTTTESEDEIEAKLLLLSRGTAIILLILYVLFLGFQLGTHKKLYQDAEEDDEEPKFTLYFAIGALCVVTTFVAICSEYLVGSIEGVVTDWGISETFAGIVLLPIVGNAAEHLSSVSMALKDKMDVSIGVAIGSSIQIALFVTPFLVLLGWIMGVELSLYFEIFETAVIFICIIVVNNLISDGESTWLEGAMLLAVYAILAIAFWVL